MISLILLRIEQCSNQLSRATNNDDDVSPITSYCMQLQLCCFDITPPWNPSSRRPVGSGYLISRFRNEIPVQKKKPFKKSREVKSKRKVNRVLPNFVPDLHVRAKNKQIVICFLAVCSVLRVWSKGV